MAKKQKKQLSAKEASPSIGYPLLGAAAFFLLVCLAAPASIKNTAIVLMLSTIMLGICCWKRLHNCIYLPFLVLTIWVLCSAFSGSYATSGKFFLAEISKVIVAFSLSILLLLYDRGEAENTGRRVAGVLAVAIAIASLVSIDMFSTHLIASPVIKFLNLFTHETYGYLNSAGEVRMNSLFVNANVYAGISGIGTFLSLGLAATEPKEHKSHRIVYLIALYVNALAFVLVLSRGAIVFIAVAFLLYLFLEDKDHRMPLLALMVETLVLSAIAAAIIAAVAFGKPSDGFHPIPLLCTVGGAALLCVSERVVQERTLRISSKTAVSVMCAMVTAIILFGIVAVLWTGPIDMSAEARLVRTIYPEPGNYMLTVDSTTPVTVAIRGQNQQDIMLNQYVTLYEGPASGAAFCVPEDCRVVHIRFRPEEVVTIHSATYSGTDSGRVPLDYKLLPEFVSERLQGVLAHHNAVQRFVYFEDGMKLFRQSPIIGLGLGSFENGLKSVQSYYYETKFVHNHYVQSLLDTGIIGLLFFVGTILTSLWALLKVLRRHPLAPALVACIAFMAGQAFMDLIFSAYAYLPFAYGVFILANLIGGDALPVPGKKVQLSTMGVIAVLLTTFSILVGSNVSAQNLVAREKSFEASVAATKQDPFEWADHALSYVMSSLEYPDDEEIRLQADAYALRLGDTRSNSIHLKLSEYYLRTDRPEEALSEAEKHVTHTASDPDAWQAVMDLLMRYDTGTDDYHAGIIHINELLLNWNAQNLGTITLNEDTVAFLAEIR